jgi:hypothetical protein
MFQYTVSMGTYSQYITTYFTPTFHMKNTTNSEKSIFGIIITKSIKTTCQWSQQSLQTIARPPALFWHL